MQAYSFPRYAAAARATHAHPSFDMIDVSASPAELRAALPRMDVTSSITGFSPSPVAVTTPQVVGLATPRQTSVPALPGFATKSPAERVFPGALSLPAHTTGM